MLLGKKGVAKLGVTVRPEDLAKLEDAELPTWNLEGGSKSKSSLCFVGEKIGAEPQTKLRQPSQGGVEKPGPEWPTLAESVPPRAVEKPAAKGARALRYERRRQRKRAAASEDEDAREVALDGIRALGDAGFEHDEAAGLPDEGIPPGTRWEDVPMNWVCPECGARKDDFEMVQV